MKKKEMKTVAILLTTRPEYGGEHSYLTLLAEALESCNGKLFHVVAICVNRFWLQWCKERKIEYTTLYISTSSTENIIYYNHHPFLAKLLKKTDMILESILKKYKVDILICGQQGYFLGKCPCKLIRPIHDLMHKYEPSFLEFQQEKLDRELIFSVAVKTADVILVDSKLGKEQVLESYPKRKKGSKIEVLPFVAPKHAAEDSEVQMELPPRYIFYPAQFWTHKNHLNLIKAIGVLKDELPDIRLILVGSEKNNLKNIQNCIAEKKLQKYVKILGFVPDEQLAYLYRHAVAMVMPSYFGPTNIPPLEAMSLGCPVIVSDKYAMPEQVGDAGLLFHPDSYQEIAQCIRQVWKNETLRQRMILKGYEKSKAWTRTNFKSRFIHIVMRELKTGRIFKR